MARGRTRLLDVRSKTLNENEPLNCTRASGDDPTSRRGAVTTTRVDPMQARHSILHEFEPCSARAFQRLRQRGYRNGDTKGGLGGWTTRGMPVETKSHLHPPIGLEILRPHHGRRSSAHRLKAGDVIFTQEDDPRGEAYGHPWERLRSETKINGADRVLNRSAWASSSACWRVHADRRDRRRRWRGPDNERMIIKNERGSADLTTDPPAQQEMLKHCAALVVCHVPSEPATLARCDAALAEER